ncbi:MAG: nucleotide exchange factor GrpE [Anaerolineae bacterium]
MQRLWSWLHEFFGAQAVHEGRRGGCQDETVAIATRLDEMQQLLGTVAQHLVTVEALAAVPRIEPEQGNADAHLASVEAGLAALDKQLGRAGREQLKTNSLFEAQQQQTQAALDQLRGALARREAEIDRLRAETQTAQATARVVVIERLLPVLDSLHDAIEAGDRLSDQLPPVAPPAVSQPLSFGERLAWAFGWRAEGPARPSVAADPPMASDEGQIGLRAAETAYLRAALDAWRQGLAFVEERLLETLAADDVQPMRVEGALFDPHRHVAIDTVPATQDVPSGTIVSEFRRGYTIGESVLRPAEVVVAKGMEDTGHD